MNEIKIKVKFKKGLCYSQGIKLVQNDYNSTKLVFEFDDNEGTKIFELRDSDDNVILADEIVNNELILARFDEHDNAYPIFTKEGEYVYEVSLYKDNSKLTSAYDKFKVNAEQVIIDGEIVETYTPMFDNLLSDLAGALQETDNIDIDVEKIGNTSTVTITKKDGQQETVQILDGEKGDTGEKGEKGDTGSIGPQGPQGIQGPIGPQGKAFTISKTYSSILEMNADFDNMQVGDYVMIASSVETEDNAKLYTKGTSSWIFISDFSGATGIQGEQGPQGIQGIQGEQGIQGIQGETGATGNGISTIQKTSTSGLVDTYTITYTNGNTDTLTVTNGEDGEDLTDELEETNSRLGYLSTLMNLFEKITGTGTSDTLNDTSNTIMKLGLNTNTTTQNTTTGKNIFNGVVWQKCILNTGLPVNIGTGSTVINSSDANNINFSTGDSFNGVISAPINVEAGQNYVLTLKLANTLSTVRLNILKYLNNEYSIIGDQNVNQNDGDKQYLISVPNDTTQIVILISGTSSNLANCSATNIQLEKGTTSTSYEPYTGGQPAPSPSYPQTVHTISGDNIIKIDNKNLLNITTFSDDTTTKTTNGITATIKDGKIHISGTSSARTTFTLKKNNFTVSNEFYYYCNSINSVTRLELQCKVDGATKYLNSYGNANFQNATTSFEYTSLYIVVENGQTVNHTFTPMVVEGSTLSQYEPYKQQTYPINLGDIELCKIGDYQDVLFKNTLNSEYYDSSLELNKWYKLGKVRKLELNISNMDNNEDYPGWKNLNQLKSDYPSVNTSLQSTTSFMSNIATSGISINTLGNNAVLWLQKAVFNLTETQWKTQYPNLVFTLYYGLQTPTYTLLNDTLQTQLDNIQYALAYDTQTNISQTNTDLPFIIDAETYVDLTDYVKNTDYASSSKGGVIKTGYSSNIDANGNLYATNLSYTNYQNVGVNHFISKGTLENVLRGYGLIE